MKFPETTGWEVEFRPGHVSWNNEKGDEFSLSVFNRTLILDVARFGYTPLTHVFESTECLIASKEMRLPVQLRDVGFENGEFLFSVVSRDSGDDSVFLNSDIFDLARQFPEEMGPWVAHQISKHLRDEKIDGIPAGSSRAMLVKPEHERLYRLFFMVLILGVAVPEIAEPILEVVTEQGLRWFSVVTAVFAVLGTIWGVMQLRAKHRPIAIKEAVSQYKQMRIAGLIVPVLLAVLLFFLSDFDASTQIKTVQLWMWSGSLVITAIALPVAGIISHLRIKELTADAEEVELDFNGETESSAKDDVVWAQQKKQKEHDEPRNA